MGGGGASSWLSRELNPNRQDLVAPFSVGARDDGLVAGALPHERLPERREVRDHVLAEVVVPLAQDPVRLALAARSVLDRNLGSRPDDPGPHDGGVADLRTIPLLLEFDEPRREAPLLVLRRLVLGVLAEVAMGARGLDRLRDRR